MLVNKIYDKHVSALKVIKEVYAEYFEKLNELEVQQIRANQQKNKLKRALEISGPRILVDGDIKLELVLCPACNPQPGDKIIAKSDKEGMKIHSIGCRALQTVHYNKLYQAHRFDVGEMKYYLHLILHCGEEKGVLMQLLKIFDFYGVLVQSIQSLGSDLEISLEFSNPSKMSYIVEDVSSKAHISIISKEIT
jgi:(p)ppGpp synthase/HD superfamily hydrolase